MNRLFIIVFSLGHVSQGLAAGLVPAESIAVQKRLTEVSYLDNGIPVIIRNIPSSELVQLLVTFDRGTSSFPSGHKSVLNLLMNTMTMEAKGFKKERVYELTEKFALSLGCSAGIEMSSCSLGTINDHWSEVLPLFAALLNQPTLTGENLELQRQRELSAVQSQLQDPEGYSNDLVNQIYYPTGHPYFDSIETSLREIPKITQAEVATAHQQLMRSNGIQITVASSLDRSLVMKDLNASFAHVPKFELPTVVVSQPKFRADQSMRFASREIPTAYLRIKFNGFEKAHPDEVAIDLMMKIFDDQLSEEIRTKRSLSYSIYAFMIQHRIGIGMIGASTSNPKETLEAVTAVVEHMKSTLMSKKDLEEHKTVYVTNYLLAQETHSSLASALASSYFYRGTTD